MKQQSSDQGWEQLQEHIAGFLSQALRSDIQKIEYKPQFTPPLMEVPPE
ncbi:MAG TPA: hypothetical protein PLU95_05990 [Syntrophales bacterium]|nr:hypothetical protein [Syntrophales bacterium]HPL67555.1 hypothetical protein [Smithellaceae bacterium]HPN08833.1 hypothetical protein [Syntrophales bacterium]HPX81552.1 hypothetical protein [Syntrophales bacterium]HQB13455.1 hypothetical protein [Syntrophales bacterium]